MNLITFLNQRKNILILTVIALFLASIQLYSFSVTSFPLTGDDTIIHYEYIKEIVALGRIDMQGFYPFLMHIIVAFLYQITNIPIEYLLFGTTVFVVSLLPFSFYYLAKVLTKNEKVSLLIAIITPLACVFGLSPYRWGGYPFLWGLTFLWFYLGFTISSLESKKIIKILISVILAVGLFLIHSPELVTSALFLTIYFIVNWKKSIKDINLYLWIILNLSVFTLIYYLIHTIFPVTVGFWGLSYLPTSFFKWLQDFILMGPGYLVSSVNLTLLVFCIWGILTRLHRKNLESSDKITFNFLVLLLLIYLDISTLHLFHFLYKFTFPWADQFRFFEFFTFPIAYFASFGLQSFITWYRNSDRHLQKSMWLYLTIVFVLVPIILFSIVLKTNVIKNSPTKEVVESIKWIDNNLEEGLILNDICWGYSAGQKVYRAVDSASWINVLTKSKVTFPYIETASNEKMQKRLYVLENIQSIKQDKLVQQYIQEENLQYVYWSENVRQNHHHEYLNMNFLKQKDIFSQIYSSSAQCNEEVFENCVYIFQINSDF